MRIEASTIIRTVVLIIALLNQALYMSGRSLIPIVESDVEALITILFTVFASLVAWWKNNSFTKEAIEADKLLEKKKNHD